MLVGHASLPSEAPARSLSSAILAERLVVPEVPWRNQMRAAHPQSAGQTGLPEQVPDRGNEAQALHWHRPHRHRPHRRLQGRGWQGLASWKTQVRAPTCSRKTRWVSRAQKYHFLVPTWPGLAAGPSAMAQAPQLWTPWMGSLVWVILLNLHWPPVTWGLQRSQPGPGTWLCRHHKAIPLPFRCWCWTSQPQALTPYPGGPSGTFLSSTKVTASSCWPPTSWMKLTCWGTTLPSWPRGSCSAAGHLCSWSRNTVSGPGPAAGKAAETPFCVGSALLVQCARESIHW